MTRIATIMQAGVLAPALLLSSCVTSTGDYLTDAVGYAITRGEVVNVENLSSVTREHLSDGIAILIRNYGCSVTMQFGRRTETIALDPGCLLVYGGNEDYILRPYVRPEWKPPAEKAPAVSAPDAKRGPASVVETEPAPDVKTDPTPEVKTDAASDMKTDATPATKTGAAPEAQADSSSQARKDEEPPEER